MLFTVLSGVPLYFSSPPPFLPFPLYFYPGLQLSGVSVMVGTLYTGAENVYRERYGVLITESRGILTQVFP